MVLRQKVLYAEKVGGQAISVQDENTDRSHTDRRKKRWFTRWWAWCLWVLIAVLLAVFSISLWAWTQRHSLIENLVVEALADSGFEAELEIASLSRTQANIKDIRLRRDGQVILRIEDVRADYVWPDIRNGQLKRLHVNGATGRLSLGEDWRPTESWIRDLLENGSGDSDSAEFPENGVRLTDATLVLISPLGEATAYIDADIPSAKDFESEITLAPSDLSYAGYSAIGAGFGTIKKSGSDLRINGQTQAETLSNGQLDIDDAHMRVDGTLDLSSLDFSGGISVDSNKLSSDLFASGPARLAWDGSISPRGDFEASGTWMIAAENARSPRPARAAEVAETLSLFSALRVVPVTENYAPQIRNTVEAFILGSDVAGQGRLEFGAEGFTVNPIGAFSVKSPDNQLELRARAEQDFYVFDKSANVISARMDAEFDRPVDLSLSNISLQASSGNGVQLNGIQSFSTNLTTQSDWRATDAEGRPVRLGPLNTSLEYDGTTMPRRLSLNTALDYDGDLPGGYVEGLSLDGRLDVRLYEARQALDFTPRRNSLVTLRTLETPTNWQGENIRFSLPPSKNLFTRTAKQAKLSATLNTADFTLTHPKTDIASQQRLDIEADSMKLDGTLLPNSTQDWSVDFSQAQVSSETLPGPGTRASAAEAILRARLATGRPPQIELTSASITAETPLVQLSEMGVTLRGTPEAYSVNHTGGTITVTGSELAETAKAAGLVNFPANGTVEFENGAFKGTARLKIAKANDADVGFEYTYQNGAGTAAIEIPSILFEPKGLQPQTLIPAFRGKVARVEGEARAKLNITFSEGVITDSNGTIQLVDMAVGTAPGPITGLNTTLSFASLLPLQTDGQQTLTMKSFNPGYPLEDGVMTFNLTPEGVEVISANWPIGNGSFAVDPFTWRYAAEENRVTMRVKDIALGDFLNDVGNKKIEATGNVVGVFPIVVRGIDVLIENGKVSVPEGGVIKYDPGPGVQSYSEDQAIKVLREKRINEYAALAQDALREFRYRELSASLDGPLNGDVEIGLVFDGSNKNVLNRQPFRFDMKVRGELFNIARSFDSNAQVKSEILRNNGKLPAGVEIGN